MSVTVVAEIGINHNGSLDLAKQLIEKAAWAGADYVKFQKREPELAVPQDQWDGMMLESFKRCADFLDELDVRIALDNHGVSTNDGDWQLSLIERVGSARIGVNLDTMNYRWYGHEVDQIDRFYEILAPHVFHVHMTRLWPFTRL